MTENSKRTSGLRIYPSIIKEFIRAVAKGRTYDIRRNGYLVFGILWGIPVPLVTMAIALYYRNMPVTAGNMISELVSRPFHIFLLMHPVLFGIIFGAMGTVRHEKEDERVLFERSLMDMNEKLKNTNKKLQELDGLKDSFLSMVSHELWTPLTTVQGYVTFLQEGTAGPLNARQKDMLEITEEQVDSLSNLIGDLVDITRIEANKLEVIPEQVNMNRVVSMAVDSLRRFADEKKIMLENCLPDSIPDVLADGKRMMQVFGNLLGNAIKFTPEGGAVSISACEEDERVIFAVTDTGIGIREEELDRIFDKFYQVDSTGKRRYGGCGLGLVIIKSIIELHGGRIWVESEPGQGSTFFFELNKSKNRNVKFLINKDLKKGGAEASEDLLNRLVKIGKGC